MGENQRNWRRPFAALVDEMDTYTSRRIEIVVKGGHPLNLPLPIELILPVLANLFHVVETYPVIPVRTGNRVRPPRPHQPLAKIFDRRFRARDVKSVYCHFLSHQLT